MANHGFKHTATTARATDSSSWRSVLEEDEDEEEDEEAVAVGVEV